MKNHNRKLSYTARRRQLFPERRNYLHSSGNGPDEDYGLAEPLVNDMLPEIFLEKQKKFLMSLETANKTDIEFNTREQSDSQTWFKERRIRLTASRFGQICKMRSTTSCKNTIYDLLYACEVQAKSLQYGRDMEAIARTELKKNINKKIETCSLLIDPIIPYLAASPGN